METVIRKWGNSPAFRLSAAAMKLANFDLDQRVTIKAEKGRIVIEPRDKVEYKIEDLVAGMTAKSFFRMKCHLVRLWVKRRFDGHCLSGLIWGPAFRHKSTLQSYC